MPRTPVRQSSRHRVRDAKQGRPRAFEVEAPVRIVAHVVTIARLHGFINILWIPLFLFLSLPVAMIFWNSGSRAHLCICEHGTPPLTRTCHQPDKVACAECSSGYNLAPSMGRGVLNAVAICRPAAVPRAKSESPGVESKSAASVSGPKKGTILIRGEGTSGKDARQRHFLDCPEPLVRAFDAKRGHLELKSFDFPKSDLTELVAACAHNWPGLNAVSLAGNGLQPGVENFLREIWKNCSIEVLGIRGTFAGTPLIHALSSVLSGLRAVVVETGAFENDGVEAEFISNLVSVTSLRALYFKDLVLQRESLSAIGSVLAKNPHIQKLTVSNVSVPHSSELGFLKFGKGLKMFDCSRNLNDPWNESNINSVIKQMPHLISLNLSQLLLTAEKLLPPMASLESIDLSSNRLYASRTEKISGHMFSRLPRLIELNLRMNFIDNEHLDAFFPPTSHLLALSRLVLHMNSITDIAAFSATVASMMPALQELDLSLNSITGPSVIKFLGALPTSSKLHSMNLDWNCISREDSFVIQAAAERLPMLIISGLRLRSSWCD